MYVVGNSLVVQWLGFGAFTAMTWVQCLVGELRSCKLHGSAKKNQKGNRDIDVELSANLSAG